MSDLHYVGVRPCGCAAAWVSNKLPAKDIAAELAKWVKKGLAVERKPLDWAKENLRLGTECPHNPKQPSLLENQG